MDQIMISIHELQWIKKNQLSAIYNFFICFTQKWKKKKKKKINEKSKNEIRKECFLKLIAGLSFLKSNASDLTNNVLKSLSRKKCGY